MKELDNILSELGLGYIASQARGLLILLYVVKKEWMNRMNEYIDLAEDLEVCDADSFLFCYSV